MFLLKFAEKNKEAKEVENRLKQLSLSFKSEIDESITSVVLEEDGTQFSGLESINNHLEKVSSELNSWYYCDC
ncbi:MAG: hypothetical protein NXI23_07885 [Bacteroidetes bacterium]|jgi:hypothetical protein|nr:hypothetical protein [Bacteroidota bacterium]MDF1865056.1 hypothetical protein [Saprospiraceae bacterium]